MGRDSSTGRILSIDQGTSGTKALVFNLKGEILASRTVDYVIHHPKPGFVEIDPEVLFQSVLSACEAVLHDYESDGGSRRDLLTIGISNQRESFLLWDRESRPASPVVVWQCKRSADLCGLYAKDTVFRDMVRERTGLVMDPYFSGTKAAYLAQTDDTLRKRIRSGDILFGTVDSWLLWKLSGGSLHATDITNASRTMLFDIRKRSWDQDILEKFSLKGLVLPETRSSDAGFGSTDLGGLFDSPVAIGAVVGDSHAAAFGEGLFRPGEAKVTLGTGSSILLNTGSAAVDSSNGMVTTVCWALKDRVDYALEGIVVSCGSVITWLRDQLGLFGDSRDIDVLADQVDHSGGVYVVPGFSGIGAPWWKLDAKAAILGLDFGHDKRHVSRAALESIVFQITDVLNAMALDVGKELSAIRADGGLTVSNLVVTSLSALADCPVHIASMKQASAWGAALLAGLAEGLYPDLDAIDSLISSRDTRLISPKAKPALSESYQGWRAILQDY